ncbi:putative tubby-like domain-containing protein [Lupinus albus]|uniref:Putative tubby-like domain-containing protein n=1 Tax=Lupinus albus TaxID=3870 RepID=A0A6A4PDP2_LUPAL|nr:putative tubby-like domain-containing protein [Lupinus albus]
MKHQKMTKVYPQILTSSTTCLNSKRETYTIWMKSLVFHSNGCTVYDSNGDIVYRVDNYHRKGKREVNLMDVRGKIICTVKKLLGFGNWDGFRCNNSNYESMKEPWFQVKRCNKMMRRKILCEIKVGCQKYCIVRTSVKEALRIVNIIDGHIVAEAKQKYSLSGVALDNDVLTLEVVTDIDHSLVMALIMVYGLICGRM